MKNRIEEIRRTRGIRQEEFARAMGVSRQTISSLETGRYNPSIRKITTLKIVSEVLTVKIFPNKNPIKSVLKPPASAAIIKPKAIPADDTIPKALSA